LVNLASPEFWIALLQIIGVNIVLSGDNAVVIALAARGLPAGQQKRAVAWGSGAAVVMRIVLTIVAVQLLLLPYLKLVGAVLLLWIAVKLLIPGKESEGHGTASSSLASAVRTILLADLVMSLDNVIAVAAAAKGSTVLLILGLAISIPLVVFASRLLLTLMDRVPVIITLGAALLGWVAGEMAVTDPVAKGWVDAQAAFLYDAASAVVPAFLHYAASAAGAIGVVLVGTWLASRATRAARKVAPVAVAQAPGRLQRVLLAVDGSEGAAKAVRHLIALGQNLREPKPLDVHLLNVQRPVSGDVATFVAGETLDDYYRERSEHALAPARALLAAAGLAPHEHRRVGDPGPLISEVARVEGSDLIVMGARGLGTHTGALLGSVARSTVENAGIPVLLVK
jgi:YjbE family integral membrane protein